MEQLNVLDNFINSQWLSLCKFSPQVGNVLSLLEKELNVKLEMDHIAYRTFNTGPFRLNILHDFALDAGYYVTGNYNFHDKHVVAKSYSHLTSGKPRLFLSELQVEKLSAEAQNIIGKRILSVKPLHDRTWLNTFGNAWYSNKITDDEVALLSKESEYAEWVLLHGLKPNHFAFDVSKYNMNDIVSLLDNKLQFKINTSGGRIKGSPGSLLEQCSVMAEHRLYPGVSNSLHSVGYIEFCKRYVDGMHHNKAFDGFIENSADKIFESTFKDGNKKKL